MLLRRIALHIQKQDWVAVALDFAIVVVGVFIGIQVSNWNSALEDERTGRIIVERLQRDFEQLERRESGVIPKTESALQASKQALELVAATTVAVDSKSFCEMLNPARSFREPPAPAATYLQLVANGEMQLITDEALRSALAVFEARRDEHEKLFQIVTDISLELAPEFWRLVDVCDVSALHPSRRFDDHIQDLLASADFAGALNSIASAHEMSLFAHKRTLSQASKVLSAIGVLQLQ